MIIFLSEVQKQHLNLLHHHSPQVLIDFCKLAIDYLNVGINSNKHILASEKLDVSVVDIQNLVYALVYLLIEGCKHNLSEEDFRSSLAIAGFTEDKQEVLVKLYKTKKNEILNALFLLQQKSATYQDFHWRFGVQVASRAHDEEMKPIIEMDFVLSKPKDFKKTSQINKIINTSNTKVPDMIINNSIEDAKAANQCQNIIEHVLLQCDIPNIVHLTNKLDQALKESKSQHVRKVQRAL